MIEQGDELDWVWDRTYEYGAWWTGGTVEGPVSGRQAWWCYVIDYRFPPSDPSRWDEDAQASVYVQVTP